MDIKRIDELPAASTPQGTDLLPLWQGDGTRKAALSEIQATGPAGKDGVSPTVKVSKSGTTTTVTITHRGWERLGADAPAWRQRNLGGWSGLLPHFRQAAAAP